MKAHQEFHRREGGLENYFNFLLDDGVAVFDSFVLVRHQLITHLFNHFLDFFGYPALREIGIQMGLLFFKRVVVAQ